MKRLYHARGANMLNILYNIEEEDLEEVVKVCRQLQKNEKLRDDTKKVFEILGDDAEYRLEKIREHIT